MIRKNSICVSSLTKYPYVKDIITMFPNIKQLYEDVQFDENSSVQLHIIHRKGTYPCYVCFLKLGIDVIGYKEFKPHHNTEILLTALTFQADCIKHNFLKHAPTSMILIN